MAAAGPGAVFARRASCRRWGCHEVVVEDGLARFGIAVGLLPVADKAAGIAPAQRFGSRLRRWRCSIIAAKASDLSPCR